jgi:CHAT domain-containing protein
MFSHFPRLILILLLLASLTPAQTTKLVPEKVFEQQIKGGETQIFQIELEKGKYTHLSVWQKGVDVMVRLSAPDGKLLAERDAPNSINGPEELSIITETEGVYKLEIKPLDDKAKAGNFSLQWEKPRRPKDKDLLRVQTEQTFAEAMQLNLQNPKENSEKARLKLEEAKKGFAELKDIYWLALTLETIGGIVSNSENPQNALPFYQNALTLYAQIKVETKQAELLNVLGVLHSRLKQSEKAMEFYQQSIAISRKLGDKSAESNTLTNLAYEFLKQKDYEKALITFQQIYELRKSNNDLAKAAETLEEIADLYAGQKKNADLLAVYHSLLTLYQQLSDQESEALTFNRIGVIYGREKNYAKALEFQTKALEIYRRINKKPEEARVLRNLAANNYNAGNKKQALELYRQSLDAWREAGKLNENSDLFDLIVNLYKESGETEKVAETYQEAVTTFQTLKADKLQAIYLNRLGVYFSDLTDKQKDKSLSDQAITNFTEAAEIFHRLNEKLLEARTNKNLAAEYYKRGENQKVVDTLQPILAIWRELKDKSNEADTWRLIADAQENLGQYEKAEKSYLQSLTLYSQLAEPNKKALVYNGLAVVSEKLTDLQKALENYRLAVPLFREAKDRTGEMVALTNIGKMLHSLGKYDAALDNYNLSLVIARELKDRASEIDLFRYTGEIYQKMGEKERAKSSFEYALKLAVESKDETREATVLFNLATQLATLNATAEEKQQALKIYQRCLEIARKGGSKENEQLALQGIALIYYLNDDYQASFEYLQKALPIVRSLNQIRAEASLLGNFMIMLKHQGNLRLAILYGKQSVNLYQKIRANLKNADQDLQQSFLKSNEDIYRKLADLLIKAGRIPEAQQILGLLKEEEYFDFVQRDGDAAKKLLGNIELSPEEEQAVTRYQEIADRITALGAEYEALKKLRPATPEEKAQTDEKLAKLRADLDAATRTFNLMLKQIETEFAKTKTTDIAATIRENSGLQADLRRWKMSKTAFLSTIVGDENYYVILTTPTVQIAGKTPVPAAELNKLVHDFREAVQNPCACLDPRPLGEKLYKILLGPIQKQLTEMEKQAGGKPLTLAWSLDGTLRYLPVAAIWDGKQYLAEKYLNVVFTLASRTRLGENPNTDWRGLGLGVSQAWGDFKALPAVKDELMKGAIRDDQKTDSSGIVPGKILLDKDFTENTFSQELSGGEFPLIHIASHFAFKPGNEKQSYLLLGDGGQLSLDKIRNSPDFAFDNVELLTLSACNTATGGAGSDGKEVEGFAVLAQSRGAMSVLATLWSVADDSTGALMAEFYRQHQEKKLSKIESLRAAQLALLNGTLKPNSGTTRRGELAGETNKDSSLPAFQTDPNKPFAHPYYWSPFVLIGNWR